MGKDWRKLRYIGKHHHQRHYFIADRFADIQSDWTSHCHSYFHPTRTDIYPLKKSYQSTDSYALNKSYKRTDSYAFKKSYSIAN